MRCLASLPYDFEIWYPLLRGHLACSRTADWMDASAERSWRGLAPGESLLVVDGQPSRDPFAALRALRAPDRLAEIGASLPADLEVEGFHVFPGTGGGWVLLPAGDAFGYMLGLELLPRGRRRWRWAASLMRLACRLGYTRAPATAKVALVTRRPRPAFAPIERELGGRIAAVSSGVPGADRKLTVMLAPTRELDARFVKISVTPHSAGQLEREVQGIERVGALCERFSLAPRLLCEGRYGTTRYLVLEALEGRRTSERLTGAHVDFLGYLQGRSLTRRPLDGIRRFTADQQLLARLATRDSWSVAFTELVAALEAYFAARPIACAFAHGDFTPWNLRLADDRLMAFDWEHHQRSAPALHDLFHFVVQSGVLQRRRHPEQILERLVNIVTGPARALLTGARLSTRDALGLFGLYLLHVAVADEERNRRVEPGFEQVVWLRDSRTLLARLVAAELARGGALIPRGAAA